MCAHEEMRDKASACSPRIDLDLYWASTCSTRWSVAPGALPKPSAHGCCVKRAPPIDQEESFRSSRMGAASPPIARLPPGIFGYREGQAGFNPQTYECMRRAAPARIDEAKRLLRQAGYPNGRDAKTGEPLVTTSQHGRRRRRQVAHRLAGQAVPRSTATGGAHHRLQRFQEKVRTGAAHCSILAGMRLPDPENFLFLLYGDRKQGQAPGRKLGQLCQSGIRPAVRGNARHGQHAATQQVIDRMMAILRHEAPWVWGFHPRITLDIAAGQRKPTKVGKQNFEIQRVDPGLRERLRAQWISRCLGRWRCWCAAGGPVPVGVAQLSRHEHASARAGKAGCGRILAIEITQLAIHCGYSASSTRGVAKNASLITAKNSAASRQQKDRASCRALSLGGGRRAPEIFRRRSQHGALHRPRDMPRCS